MKILKILIIHSLIKVLEKAMRVIITTIIKINIPSPILRIITTTKAKTFTKIIINQITQIEICIKIIINQKVQIKNFYQNNYQNKSSTKNGKGYNTCQNKK